MPGEKVVSWRNKSIIQMFLIIYTPRGPNFLLRYMTVGHLNMVLYSPIYLSVRKNLSLPVYGKKLPKGGESLGSDWGEKFLGRD